MFKKIMATALCVALAFTAVGCNKKETPEKLARELTTKLAQAKYLDTNINATVEAVDGTANIQRLGVNSNVKIDMTGEFPKIAFDGTVAMENMITIPVKLYIDENNVAFTLLNQSQQVPVPDQLKQQIRSAKNSSNINDTLGKHVEETDYNGKKALKVNYDLQQINSVLSTAITNPTYANTNITKMDIYYVMSDKKDNIDAIIADVEANNNGDVTKVHLDITINSTDQPFQLAPPENSETSTTQMAS